MAALIAAHGLGPGHADGIMGLTPDAKILPIKMNDAMGGNQNGIDGPLRYAVDHGATVINMSFAGGPLNQQEKEVVHHALKKDVLLVAGSGDDGQVGLSTRCGTGSQPAGGASGKGAGRAARRGAQPNTDRTSSVTSWWRVAAPPVWRSVWRCAWLRPRLVRSSLAWSM